MSDKKKQPDSEPKIEEVHLSLIIKGGGIFLLFIFIIWFIQVYELIKINNFSTYAGFFLSCLGVFYISYKVFSGVSINKGRIKYFTKCELPSRLNLILLLVFTSMIVILMAMRIKGSNQVDQIAFIPLSIALVFIPAKQTRTATILLVLLTIYFFSGIFFSEQEKGILVIFMGGILLTTMLLGGVSLTLQKPRSETLLDWTEELQGSRRESKEILHLLSEFPVAKEISNIMKVPFDELENAQRPLKKTIQRAVWDLEYEAHQGAEKKLSLEIQNAKKKFITDITSDINKIKEHSLSFNTKEKNHILSAIEQSEKHLDSIRQHIQTIERIRPHLEKIKAQLLKTTPRLSSSIVSINGALDHVDLFQKNITPTLKETTDVFKEIKPYIEKQESRYRLIEKEIQDALKKIQEKAHELEKTTESEKND
jgi:hypothetical protein